MSRAQLTSTVEQSSGGVVAPFLAGKNKVINGDFLIWQRGTSFTGVSGLNTYTADRWAVETDGSGVATVSQQAFTSGAAPVTGYESTYFSRISVTTAGSSTFWRWRTRLEDVRTFAGQTITISFWARGSSSGTNTVYVGQNFGSGGSSYVETGYSSVSFTTSWARYSVQIAVPSVSGKTIGASSFLQIMINTSLLTLSSTSDIWGVQVENGPVATPFTTASGTLQGELSLCQRYFYQWQSTGAAYCPVGVASTVSTTELDTPFKFPEIMRTAPSASFSSVTDFYGDSGTSLSGTTVALIDANGYGGAIRFSGLSGLTANTPRKLRANNTTSATIQFSAEL